MSSAAFAAVQAAVQAEGHADMPAAAADVPSLGAEAFERAFPFFLALDAALRVCAVGASLRRALPDLAAGDTLAAHFEVQRPRGAAHIDDWRRHGRKVITLKSTRRSELTLRGGAEAQEGGGLLLLVSPVLTSMEALHALGLGFHHFASHDAVGELLMLARSTQMSARDAERMAERLQARSGQLSTILELGQNGVAYFDASGALQHTNGALLAMLELDRVDTIGLQLADLQAHLARRLDPREPAAPVFQATDEDEPAARLLQLAVPRPAVVRLTSRRTDDGGRVFYLRDVTAETEVDRMKSEFLTTAAHELRTPIVSIFGFTELLLNRPLGEERRRDVLQTLHRQSQRLIDMLGELLDLSRIEARQGKDLRREACRLGPLVEQALALPALAEAGTAARLKTRLAHGHAVLNLDAEKTVSAFAQVLSNALRFSAPDGEVLIDTLEGEVHGGPAVGLRFTDCGIGMTPEQSARVCERFYRADSSGHVSGTGLGMSLAKEITELQGGRVEIQSEPGIGTAVTLWWPLHFAAVPAG